MRSTALALHSPAIIYYRWSRRRFTLATAWATHRSGDDGDEDGGAARRLTRDKKKSIPFREEGAKSPEEYGNRTSRLLSLWAGILSLLLLLVLRLIGNLDVSASRLLFWYRLRAVLVASTIQQLIFQKLSPIALRVSPLDPREIRPAWRATSVKTPGGRVSSFARRRDRKRHGDRLDGGGVGGRARARTRTRGTFNGTRAAS